jgi:hypothetical protein
MSDYVDEYRSGYVGPIPPVNGTRVIDQSPPVHGDGEVRITDPETGGQKGQKAEQYSLIPVEAMAQVARVYAHGAEKYSRNNWRLGYDWHLSYDAMQRHLTAFWGGQDLDLDSGLPHLAHAVFHALTLLTYLSDVKYKSKDDRA